MVLYVNERICFPPRPPRQDVFAFKTHILAFLCGLGVLSELNERARDKSWLEHEEPHLIPIFLVATTSGNIKPID